MPPEPDNKMDELLKAYAKKRRTEAGEPMELHPATRRLLQAEAAKLKPASAAEPKSWLTSLWMFWPRVAVAAALVVIGGVAVMSLIPPASEKGDVFFAKQDNEALALDRFGSEERAGQSRYVLTPAVVPPTKPSDLPVVTLSDEAKSEDMLRRENVPAPLRSVAPERDVLDAAKAETRMKVAEPARTAAPAAAPVELARRSAVATAASGPAVPAPQPPVSDPVALGVALAEMKDKEMAVGRGAAPATPAPTRGLALSDAKKLDVLAVSEANAAAGQQPVSAEDTADFLSRKEIGFKPQLNNATVRSRFSQAPGANQPSLGKALPNLETTVLNTFFVEQTGEQVRVVDGDGSVYEGKIVTGDTAGATELEALAGSRLAGRTDDSRLRSLAEQELRQQQAQTTFNYQIANGQTSTVWNFRASGTNRTLKQPVTIDAVVYESVMPVAVTNVDGVAGTVTAGQSLNFYRNVPGQAPAQQRGYTVTTTPSQAAGGAVLQNNAYNSQPLNVNNALRIQGNYRIGPTNQRPFDAVPDRNQP